MILEAVSFFIGHEQESAGQVQLVFRLADGLGGNAIENHDFAGVRDYRECRQRAGTQIHAFRRENRVVDKTVGVGSGENGSHLRARKFQRVSGRETQSSFAKVGSSLTRLGGHKLTSLFQSRVMTCWLK
jgi:hypothetical protein